MRIIRDAIEAVQENLSALLIYVALTVGTQVGRLAFYVAEKKGVFGEVSEAGLGPYSIALDLLLCISFGVAMAIAFSMMGKKIDQPLWKIAGAREALRRFFALWFAISLIAIAAQQATGALATGGIPQIAIGVQFVVVLPILLLAIPVGGCVMFYGKLEWANVGEILAPLGRQFPMTMMLVLLNLFQYLLSDVVMSLDAGAGAQPDAVMTLFKGAALAVIGGYIDCVVFAGTWLLCMADRDTERDEGDFDF